MIMVVSCHIPNAFVKKWLDGSGKERCAAHMIALIKPWFSSMI
jgi:hypothetical protein